MTLIKRESNLNRRKILESALFFYYVIFISFQISCLPVTYIFFYYCIFTPVKVYCVHQTKPTIHFIFLRKTLCLSNCIMMRQKRQIHLFISLVKRLFYTLSLFNGPAVCTSNTTNQKLETWIQYIQSAEKL